MNKDDDPARSSIFSIDLTMRKCDVKKKDSLEKKSKPHAKLITIYQPSVHESYLDFAWIVTAIFITICYLKSLNNFWPVKISDCKRLSCQAIRTDPWVSMVLKKYTESKNLVIYIFIA